MANLQTLIAHYLATSYPSALPSFLSATGEPEPDTAHPPQPDLRTLAEDYLSHQLAKQFEAVALEKAQDGSWTGWTAQDVVAIKSNARVLQNGGRTMEGLSVSNLLGVQEGDVPVRWFDTATASYKAEYRKGLLVTSVDKTLSIVDYATDEVSRILEPHKSSILSFALHPSKPRYLLTGAMDGTTILTDLITNTPIQSFKSQKFVVRVAFSPCGRYMATASYDKTVVLYRILAGEHEGSRRGQQGMANGDADMDTDGGLDDGDDDDGMDLLDDTDDPALACDPSVRYTEIYRIRVDHNPEAILFVPALPLSSRTAPNTSQPPVETTSQAGSNGWLLYTTRSSHTLHYLCPLTLTSRSKSFNAHPLDTHVSFSVLNMVLHPSGRVVACQTDHSTAGERVLLYSTDPDETERLGCIWTGAETDDYVLPRMAWTTDGSALVTTSPNGYLHLLPLSGGITSLKVHGMGGQGGGEIIRDVCVVGDEVVSVGYDRVVRFTSIIDA